jgi:conserved repeat protein
MKTGNDNSGIANKNTLKVLSVEGRAIEEEEFKKKTKLYIAKTSSKEYLKDGDTNTYTLSILNVGENPARIVKVEEKLEGKAKVKKDSIKVLNSNGQDVTNDNNIVSEKVITDDTISLIINKINKDEKYKIIYDITYDESEKENTVKTITKVKGINTEEKQKEDSEKVNGTIKGTTIEILKEATKIETKAGDTNTYNVKVKNNGTYDARDVFVEDILYGDAKYIKNTLKVLDNAKNVIEDSNYTVEWIETPGENKFEVMLPLVEKGKSITVTYNVEYANLEETQEIRNIVRAEGMNTNNAELQNKNGLKVVSKGVIKNTDIEIAKNTEETELLAGNRNIYTITVKNKGQYNARDVAVTDILKGNAKYIEDTVTVESSKNTNNTESNINSIIQGIEWKYRDSNNESKLGLTIPIIEPNEIYTITYIVEHIDSEEDSNTTNKALSKGSNTTEAKSNDVTVKVKGVIKETTLDLTKTSEKKENATTNTINITNTGNNKGRNITVEETLEGNVTIVKSSVKIVNNKGEDITNTIKKDDIVVENGTIKINIPNIGKNESFKITYDVTPNEPNKDVVVTRKTTLKGSNSTQEETTSSYSVAATVKETNLDIKKTVDKSIIEAGDRNNYKIVVKNIGEHDAKDVVIEDILKGKAKYLKDSIKLSDRNIKVEHGTNTKFKIPVLEKGKSITITYKVEYASSLRDNMVTNTANVKGSNAKKALSSIRVQVLGVKENLIEKELLPKILPKAGKRERRQISLYALATIIILLPTFIFRLDYVKAKRKEMLLRRKARRRKTLRYKK